MTARSGTRKRQLRPPSVIVEPRRLSLREARLEALDRAERSELVRLEAQGYGHPRIYNLSFPPNPHYRRYDELMERATRTLREKLATGAWLVTGRDPRAAIDAPRIALTEDRFAHLEFDFERSGLQGDEVRIIEVLVSTAGALHLYRLTKQARLGALHLHLSGQPFDLFLRLAQAAKSGGLLVPIKVLKDELFASANDKALGQCVEDLRSQFERSGLGRKSARLLVANVPRQGYYVNLPGVEITIHD